jgi:hypothetical protein
MMFAEFDWMEQIVGAIITQGDSEADELIG